MKLILVVLIGIACAQLSVTGGCTCKSYLSSTDCTTNKCWWASSCQSPVCSTLTSQVLCVAVSGCNWSSNACVTTVCTAYTTTSNGGSCPLGCTTATTANSDGSFNCLTKSTTSGTLTACSSLTQTTCAQSFYCTWNASTSKCADATCAQITSQTSCMLVYTDSSNSTNPGPIACIYSGTACANANATLLTSTNCNSVSLNSYTWSTSSSSCVACSNSGSNIIIAFLLGLILVFA